MAVMASLVVELHLLDGNMSLPLLKNFDLLQTGWKKQLDPIIKNTLVNGVLLTNISLPATTPTPISTTLGRQQQGWIITDNTADCRVWRTQPFNSTTLTLEASAATTISLWVF